MGESRRRRRWTALALFSFALLASGCAVNGMPPSSPATTSTVSTPSINDATEAFTRFNSVLDGYYSGTAVADDFAPVATSGFLNELREAEKNSDRRTRTVGVSTFDSEKLVDPTQWGGFGELALVVCRDVSKTQLIDEHGNPSTTKRARTRIPMIVFFEPGAASQSELVVTKVEQWNETDYCS
ncbi:hypothetical protein ELQ90_07310 [Labedella phragmitis]|uniref:Lipoprotein n=1 Tax=Labedella phragmitis TaxID=2498849 RepID=A0A444PVH1_9MICO|nr:hypothetical protein [Labedella phragmitis]RWZ51884.1 hypothetical protein ELQ90_07310 [Labedella phragmitis]